MNWTIQAIISFNEKPQKELVRILENKITNMINDQNKTTNKIKNIKRKRFTKLVKRERKNREKNERKREKGQCYYPFTTLVLQSSTMIFMIESLLCCHFHILVGILHYRTWLVYSNDGLPQMP